MSMYVPLVINRDKKGESSSLDLYGCLLEDRVVFLNGEIEEFSTNNIVAQLLYLDSLNNEPITLIINSCGGLVTGGLAIYDVIQFIASPVVTMCIGEASSMGAILLSAGSHRLSTPNSRIMIHQPSGGAEGTASEILVQTKELRKMKAVLVDILTTHTKQKRPKVAKDIEKDFYMSAEEALNYGLIDEIITNKTER